MKPSRYNVHVRSDAGREYCVNTLNRAVVVLPRCTESGADTEDSDGAAVDVCEMHGVQDTGLLVPGDEDESARFAKWYSDIQLDLTEVHCTVAVTGLCNLSCPYCFQLGTLRDRGGTIDSTTIRALVKWLHGLCCQGSTETLVMHLYGGEPTLFPEVLDELMTAARQWIRRPANVQFGIYTNGVELNERLKRLYLSADFKHAQVSLDGTEEVHDRRRATGAGEPTFRLAWETIRFLACESGTRVKVVVNFDNENYASVFALLELVAHSDFSALVQVAFNPVVGTAGNQQHHAEYAPHAIDSYRMWRELYAAALRLRLDVSALRLLQKGPCSFHRLGHLFVSPTGDVFECIGLLGHDGLASATVLSSYSSSVLAKRLKWIQELAQLRQQCLECRYLPICLGGCRFQALCDTGALHGHVCHRDLIEECELKLVPTVFEHEFART